MDFTKRQIQNYGDFIETLEKAGFSMGGGKGEGIYTIIPWSWDENPPYDTPVKWHTGDSETDPWEWRMRVLDEREDIAYGKVFFKKSGYITKEWYPYFLAVRRQSMDFSESYENGLVSNMAKKIYEFISEYEALPLHGIKALGGFGKEDKSKFDAAITELQMKMFITMCGRQQKVSKKGEEYGWSSTVFCTTERFFGEDIFQKATEIIPQEAEEKIRSQIRILNPEAEEKKIIKFIKG
ncbi:AlkZ-related protein [Anaeropeptidivorans aminofermentans]|uniref:AlkZ-related protein n=1 Tax=Anaeropeptidivorans aminofermentans TaxID=2934315 RepID=UPI0020244D2A|nr:hypothetical protein [Anaeropeptidivorans aminofermentans]